MHKTAELEGIERKDFPWSHQQIICRFIVNQQVPIPVVDQSPGRIINDPAKHVPVCILFIGAVNHLKEEKPHYIDEGDEKKNGSQYVFPLGKLIHCKLLLINQKLA